MRPPGGGLAACAVALWLGAGCERAGGASFADEMKRLCAADDRAAVAAGLKTREAGNVVAGIRAVDPAERELLLLRGAGEAGLTVCGGLPVELGRRLHRLPDAAGARLDPAVAPHLVVSSRSISVDGVDVIAVRDGDVDPSERAGGPRGMKLDKLSRFLGAWRRSGAAADPLVIAIDPGVPYRLLFSVLYSAREAPAGFGRFAFLVASGERPGLLPLILPDRGPPPVVAMPADGMKPLPPERPRTLILGAAGNRLLLWPMEGGPTHPLGDWPARAAARFDYDLAGVPAALAAAAGDGPSRLVIMADGQAPSALVLTLLGLARGPAGAAPLFGDVMFSPGFE